jgi:SAM-dependent methyltransferase
MDDAPTPEHLLAAEAYEELHVPSLFADWAPRVLQAADLAPGHRVLDVACGTGVLARGAAERVGTAGQVVGVDPNPAMLSVARRDSANVDWQVGAAESLPCDDARFDRVVSQFGLMFFSDRERALAEMLRVLVPEGRLAVAVWDGLERSAAYATLVDLLQRMAGQAAADALRAPFVMGDRAALERLLASAGAVDVVGQTPMGRARFPSVRAMVEADLRGWLPVLGVELEEPLIEAILAEAEDVLGAWVTPEGQMEFEVPAHIVSAARPG